MSLIFFLFPVITVTLVPVFFLELHLSVPLLLLCLTVQMHTRSAFLFNPEMNRNNFRLDQNRALHLNYNVKNLREICIFK